MTAAPEPSHHAWDIFTGGLGSPAVLVTIAVTFGGYIAQLATASGNPARYSNPVWRDLAVLRDPSEIVKV